MEIVRIYCIEDCNGLKYIGSTKTSLNIRLSAHRCHDDCSSRELDLQNCKIYTLEETDKDHRKFREQYWIHNTECVNKYKVIGFKKEIYHKQYRENNVDKIKQYQRNLYHFRNSWGGDSRYNNNLLKIDLDIFI